MWNSISYKLGIPYKETCLMLSLLYTNFPSLKSIEDHLRQFLFKYDLHWHADNAWFKFLVMLTDLIFLKTLVCPEECVRVILELIDRAEPTSYGLRDMPPKTKKADLLFPITQFRRLQYVQCSSNKGFDYFNQLIIGLKESFRRDIWIYLKCWQRKHPSGVFKFRKNLLVEMLDEGWDYFYKAIGWLSGRKNIHKLQFVNEIVAASKKLFFSMV